MAKKALSASTVLSQVKDTIEFSEDFKLAFGSPEACGTWFVWGGSGNGKSSFLMMLAKELARTQKVLYNSREEGTSLSFMSLLDRYSMVDCGSNFMVIDEDIEALTERLSKRRSPRVVIIDSLQYTSMNFLDYRKLVERFPKHLFIINSQGKGVHPLGKTAVKVMFDAMLKIWVEGYRAHSKGRFIGKRGWMNIWEEGANEYWGKKDKKQD